MYIHTHIHRKSNSLTLITILHQKEADSTIRDLGKDKNKSMNIEGIGVKD